MCFNEHVLKGGGIHRSVDIPLSVGGDAITGVFPERRGGLLYKAQVYAPFTRY